MPIDGVVELVADGEHFTPVAGWQQQMQPDGEPERTSLLCPCPREIVSGLLLIPRARQVAVNVILGAANTSGHIVAM